MKLFGLAAFLLGRISLTAFCASQFSTLVTTWLQKILFISGLCARGFG